jgi:hypothetical protein
MIVCFRPRRCAPKARIEPRERQHMKEKSFARSLGRWVAGGVGLSAAAYATYAGVTWLRYGHAARTAGGDDLTLDRFMPEYDVAEHHQTDVAAPADVTFQAASEMDLQQSPIIRAIFKSRELIMRAQPARVERPRAFLDQMRSLGWGELYREPGRIVVMGAVTQPWMADVVFRALPPEQFAAFAEPGYVKIVWTLRAHAGETGSIFRTETRAVATDSTARARFRKYWSLASPGIILIRRVTLGLVKADAERRATRMHAPAA